MWSSYAMESIVPDPSGHPVGIALINHPDLFTRPMLGVLSQVDKNCKKAVLGTKAHRKGYKDCRDLVGSSSEEIKSYFLESVPHLKSVLNLVWNASGAQCARVSDGSPLKFILYGESIIERPCIQGRVVMIERRAVYNSMLFGDWKTWNYFYNALPHHPTAFFKENNRDVCFHGYGGIDIRGKVKAHVLEYCLAPSPMPDLLICGTIIGGKFIPLEQFLEFPVLLQAILNSADCYVSDNRKTFELKGVTLPDNYDAWEAYFTSVPRYKSFNQLPKKIREGISKQYLAQKSVITKEKPNSVGCFG